MYQLRINLTYSTVASATTATSNINTALTSRGRAEQATRSSATVTLVITGVQAQADAVALRDALTSAWGAGTRTQGLASVELT